MRRLSLLAGCVSTVIAVTASAQLNWTRPAYFAPSHRLSGIGVERAKVSGLVLKRRTELMVDSHTFGILRDPRALDGARRITSPKLQKLFDDAGRRSGIPSSTIAAIAFLESFGDAKAVSPAGPKGIMQIAAGTARIMGLKITRATRYRVVTEKKLVKRKKGKPVMRTVRRKVPYSVVVKDERLIPERAVPAAARYLANLEQRYGSMDWAVFAYHCGEGCAAEFRSIAQRADVLKDEEQGDASASVARAFFSASPAHNQELYDAIRHHMMRDYSPTYWFRIQRAEQLLAVYEKDPEAYRKLWTQYRYRTNPTQRAPHRLSVWLTPEDLAYQTCDDMKKARGKSLVAALDDPREFGFALRKTGPGAIASDDLVNQEYYLQAAPSTIGTLLYIAYEARRLHEAMKVKGERWIPIEVTALVQPLDYHQRLTRKGLDGGVDVPALCTGQVFNLSLAKIPPGQREAIEFILDDLGWDGYLGFVQESSGGETLRIGCSPSSRDFFTSVYEDAVLAAQS